MTEAIRAQMTKTIRLGVTETIRLGKPKKSWLGTTNEKRPGIPRGGSVRNSVC
jgi:hypothetical protein